MCPRSVLLVGQPTSATSVGDMIGKEGFRKAVRLERGVGRMVVYPLAPTAERVEKGLTMWMHWCLCKEKKIRGVLVQHCDDVNKGRAVGPCLLNVDGEELESFARIGGV